MWSQRWDSLIDIIWPIPNENENEFIQKHIGPNATVADMVKFAQDYYLKMGNSERRLLNNNKLARCITVIN